jgi:hypothetical protein
MDLRNRNRNRRTHCGIVRIRFSMKAPSTVVAEGADLGLSRFHTHSSRGQRPRLQVLSADA